MDAIAAATDTGAPIRDSDAAARETFALLALLPVPQRLRDAGVRPGTLEPIAREAAASATVKSNPKTVRESDALGLLRGAW
jgi:alcohol dehydrogenase class IV